MEIKPKAKLTKAQIEERLFHYQELNKSLKEMEKELKEEKAFLKENVQPGMYGNMMMMIEETEVKEYIVKAHTRETLKVSEIKK